MSQLVADEISLKRRAEEPAIDNRSMTNMEQLKLFISEQNKELQDTINKKLQETIEDNNKANIQSLETMFDKKLNNFAGYVDSKIETVKFECMSAVQVLSKDVKEEITKFSDGVEDRIDYLERQAKQCDIVIKNVPYRQDESMKDYVYNVCRAIGYNNTDSIKSAFRLSRNTNKSNPIVMKFYDVADKRDFMRAYFQCQNLNLMHLGFKTKLRIVISDALTQKNNEIFKKAMQLKFGKIFWSVSTKNGLVYYRLDQKSRPLAITSLTDLNAFHVAGATQINENDTTKQPLDQRDAGESSHKLDQPMVNVEGNNNNDEQQQAREVHNEN